MGIVRRYREDSTAPLIPKGALRCATFDDFIGPVVVSEGFAIDGRSFDYQWIWDASLLEDVFWRSPTGYEIFFLGPDYEPETMVLHAPSGERCGFYVGVELWIDQEHRGQGLGAELVLAMTELLGRSPLEELGVIGFSPEGYGAHEKAWRLAHERAAARARARRSHRHKAIAA